MGIGSWAQWVKDRMVEDDESTDESQIQSWEEFLVEIDRLGKDEGICIYEIRGSAKGKIYKDDVNDGVIPPPDLVITATNEEVSFMKGGVGS